MDTCASTAIQLSPEPASTSRHSQTADHKTPHREGLRLEKVRKFVYMKDTQTLMQVCSRDSDCQVPRFGLKPPGYRLLDTKSEVGPRSSTTIACVPDRPLELCVGSRSARGFEKGLARLWPIVGFVELDVRGVEN